MACSATRASKNRITQTLYCSKLKISWNPGSNSQHFTLTPGYLEDEGYV